MITLIREAFAAGARLKKACEEASISFRTYKRWYKAGIVQADKRSSCCRPAPANKLTQQEQEMIVKTCNLPEYADLPPSQIVPSLLDKKIYYASESSFYRVLKQADQLNHRGRTSKPQKRHKPTSFKASKPNELWSWDSVP